MKQEIWQDDQPVLKEDLQKAQGSKEEAIRERLSDMFNPGVLQDSQLALETLALNIEVGSNSVAASPTIIITTGVGYSSAGERILVSDTKDYTNPIITASSVTSGDPTLVFAPGPTVENGPLTKADNGIGGSTVTPRNSGSINMPLIHDAGVPKLNFIWLGYLKITDDSIFTLSDTTSERLFVEANDGYEIQATLTDTNPDSTRFILIGEVNVPVDASALVVADINLTNEKEAQTTVSTVVPASPFQVVLPKPPVDIPVVTGTAPSQTYTFTQNATPADDEFTVNFTTGTLTFNTADETNSIDIDFNALRTRRELNLTKSKRDGTLVEVVDKPSSYQVGTTVSFHDHANAKGSGLVSVTNPHGLNATDLGIIGLEDASSKLSSSGMIVPDAGTNASALFPSATSSGTPANNVIVFKALISNEAVNVNGVVVTNSDIPIDVSFLFVDGGGSPIADGVYTFFINKATKAIERSAAGEVITDPDKFRLASIEWASPSLVLPATDLRFFGTTANENLRFETLNALSQGLAVGARITSTFNAKLVTLALGSSFAVDTLTLVLNPNGTGNQTVTFTGTDPIAIEILVDQINAQTTNILADIETGASQTLTLDADFVTGNNFDVDVNGTALSTVSFNSDHATTLADVATTLEATADIQTALVTGAREITFVTTAGTTVTLTSAVITGGATQAGVTIATLAADQRIRLLATSSLTIDGSSTSLSVFKLSGGETDSGNIKESRTSGASATIGGVDGKVVYSYDAPGTSANLINVDASFGNRSLTTAITYVGDDVETITENVI